MENLRLIIIFAYIADLIFGDPEWFPHPVRIIGKFIEFLEKKLRKGETPYKERLKGAMLAVTVVLSTLAISYMFIKICGIISPLFGALAMVYIAYTTLSIKDLIIKAKAIQKELKCDNLVNARKKLSCIVGRDTENLDKDKIIRATIESIAESTNDGIIAPLFYLAIGGPLFAIAYKAVSTLDSMIGYIDGKCRYLGWFSAKLDDVLNFIPARISGVLIGIASSSACGGLLAMTRSLKTMLRDGGKHASPNSGIPEAAVAGTLGIKLGGPYAYGGIVEDKPYIGKEITKPDTQAISKALLISFISGFLMLFIGVFLKWLI